MLTNFKVRDMISKDTWFNRTDYVHSHHQQDEDKGYEQKVEMDADVSVSSTKTSGWRGLKISLYGIKQVIK